MGIPSVEVEGEETAQKTVGDLPLVSIVTPCLNPGPRIERAIHSVANQTYPKIEHIIIDGGSTDGTLDNLRAYPGLRCFSGPDDGQTQAINKGFYLAKGEILTWLNADDWLEDYWVSKAVSAFQEDSSLGWIYGNLRIINKNIQLVARPPSQLTLSDMQNGNVIPQPGAFFMKWALEKSGPLDESLHLAMDFDLWMRFVELNVKSKYLPVTMANFEIHEGSKTGSVPSSLFAMEEASVYVKHGHLPEASLAVGRAASKIRPTKECNWRRSLESNIATLMAQINQELDPRLVRAAARTEAAIQNQHSTVSRIQMLLKVDPWRTRQTRIRIWWAIRRSALRLLRQMTHGRRGQTVPTS